MADKPVYHNPSMGSNLSRALKQIVDTVAPGMNPRRTKNRSDVPDEAGMSSHDRQHNDRNNRY